MIILYDIRILLTKRSKFVKTIKKLYKLYIKLLHNSLSY